MSKRRTTSKNIIKLTIISMVKIHITNTKSKDDVSNVRTTIPVTIKTTRPPTPPYTRRR